MLTDIPSLIVSTYCPVDKFIQLYPTRSRPSFNHLVGHGREGVRSPKQVETGEVYSVFKNESGRTTIYYRVISHSDVEPSASAPGVEWLDMSEVKNLAFKHEYEASMLKRFVQESRSGNHRMYIGDDKTGVVQQIKGSS